MAQATDTWQINQMFSVFKKGSRNNVKKFTYDKVIKAFANCKTDDQKIRMTLVLFSCLSRELLMRLMYSQSPLFRWMVDILAGDKKYEGSKFAVSVVMEHIRRLRLETDTAIYNAEQRVVMLTIGNKDDELSAICPVWPAYVVCAGVESGYLTVRTFSDDPKTFTVVELDDIIGLGFYTADTKEIKVAGIKNMDHYVRAMNRAALVSKVFDAHSLVPEDYMNVFSVFKKGATRIEAEPVAS